MNPRDALGRLWHYLIQRTDHVVVTPLSAAEVRQSLRQRLPSTWRIMLPWNSVQVFLPFSPLRRRYPVGGMVKQDRATLFPLGMRVPMQVEANLRWQVSETGGTRIAVRIGSPLIGIIGELWLWFGVLMSGLFVLAGLESAVMIGPLVFGSLFASALHAVGHLTAKRDRRFLLNWIRDVAGPEQPMRGIPPARLPSWRWLLVVGGLSSLTLIPFWGSMQTSAKFASAGSLIEGEVTGKEPANYRTITYRYDYGGREWQGRAGNGNAEFEELQLGSRVIVTVLPEEPGRSMLGRADLWLETRRRDLLGMIVAIVIGLAALVGLGIWWKLWERVTT